MPTDNYIFVGAPISPHKRQDPNGINVQILHFKWERFVLE
jgi:hypothetical protein